MGTIVSAKIATMPKHILVRLDDDRFTDHLVPISSCQLDWRQTR